MIFGALTLHHRLDLGEISWGVWWSGARTSSCSSSSCSSSTAPTSCCATRSSPGLQRANMCAVYALFGVVLIPVSFLAIRLSQQLHPPDGLHSHGPQMTRLAVLRLLRLAGSRCCSLFATLYRIELAGKRLDAHAARAAGAARREHRARLPSGSTSPPRTSSSSSACSRRSLIIAAKLQRLAARSSAELVEKGARGRRWLRLLFWPALLGYGEAAFAYASPRAHARGDLGRAHRLARADRAARRPGRARRRLPVVELGRLAQPLRLARRRRLPDLGLPAALPPARARGHAARRGALPRRAPRRRHGAPARARTTANLFLDAPRRLRARRVRRLHARGGARRALPLAGAAAQAARAPTSCGCGCRRSSSLERLTWRTIAVSLPLLTLGLAAGIVRLRERRRRRSTRSMAVDAPHLARLRRVRRRCARPGAAPRYLALGGFALVIVVRLALAGSHFT